MGYRGYHQLQLALARELPAAPLHQGDIQADDPLKIVLAKVFAAGAQTLTDGMETVDEASFDAAVTALAGAPRVVFLGVGTSAPLAQDAAYRFRTIGVQADAPADVHVQHVAARLLDTADVCIAISHTGATRETVLTLRAAREVGATTVAVTSFARSPISRWADIVLVTGGPEQSFRHEAMASRLAHLSLLDALYVAVAMRSQTSAQSALDATADVIARHRYPPQPAVREAKSGGQAAPTAGR